MSIGVKEAARKLRCSTAWVRKLLEEQKLSGVKIGRDWVVDEASIDSYRLLANTESMPPLLRWQVLGRDGFTCQDCGFQPATDRETRLLNAHHIIAVIDGGEHSSANLITLCPKCHRMRHTSGDRSVKRKKLPPPIRRDRRIVFSFYATLATSKMIRELASRWGCSQGEAMDRAISWAQRHAVAPKPESLFTTPAKGAKS